MPQYFHPGVYIEEIERGPRPIEGVPTSTAAFLGEADRGSITPRLVTSSKDYQRWFGDVFGDFKFLPYAVSGYFENGGVQGFVCRIVGDGATPAAAAFGGSFSVQAAGPGAWGNRVFARIDPSTTKKGNGSNVGFRLRLAYWTGNAAPSFDPFTDLTSTPRPQQTEDFDDLVFDDETSPDFYAKRIPFIDLGKGNKNQGPESSAFGTLVRNPNVPPGTRPDDGALLLTGGADGNPVGVNDFKGLPTTARPASQGLDALELDPYREVALVYAPGAPTDVVLQLVDHCERLKSRFAVVDAPKGITSASALDPRSQITDTEFAAFYYPWIVTADPGTGARKLVPPGGHVLGVYARTDTERGVFKAPANEILRGALDLEFDIGDGAQDTLNPRGVNAIRQFPGRGLRVWGARTMSSNALWKYVSVRRLFIFLERSIYDGTQWVVFEPNDDRLWARVIDTIRLFLRGQWRLGALFGRTEQEAFFITCDRTTMTQDDILNGRLICEIGIAPVRPAEFVIFRIFQNTAEAQQ
jgi:phage tail sheath protein FI